MNSKPICHRYTDFVLKQTQENYIQYLNPDVVQGLYNGHYNFLSQLSRKKRYLNIGTGIGSLESQGKQNGFYISACDYINNDPLDPYTFFREKQGIQLNYVMSDAYSDNFKIDGPKDTFDAAILIRFEPILEVNSYKYYNDNSRKQYTKNIYNQILQYTDTLIIRPRIDNIPDAWEQISKESRDILESQFDIEDNGTTLICVSKK